MPIENTEQNLKNILQTIGEYEQKYQRAKDSVLLMAVSKKKPVAAIQEAYKAGQRIFGESYVQESIAKQQQLTDLKDLEWHFIGPIQSNKTKDIANHFNWVHSLDRLKIINRISKQRSSSLPAMNVLLQVNLDAEETKSGFISNELVGAANLISSLPNLVLRGIMAIPKAENDFNHQRIAFKRIHQLYLELQKQHESIDTLSIGMSNDMQAAIAEGSTMVRIGTAIFGSRS